MSASRDYFPTCGQVADERLQDRIYRNDPSPSGGRGAPRGAAAASPFGPPIEWDACIDCGIAFPAGYRHHMAVRCDDCDSTRGGDWVQATTAAPCVVCTVATHWVEVNYAAHLHPGTCEASMDARLTAALRSPSPSTTSSSAFVDVVARIVLAPKEAT